MWVCRFSLAPCINFNPKKKNLRCSPAWGQWWRPTHYRHTHFPTKSRSHHTPFQQHPVWGVSFLLHLYSPPHSHHHIFQNRLVKSPKWITMKSHTGWEQQEGVCVGVCVGVWGLLFGCVVTGVVFTSPQDEYNVKVLPLGLTASMYVFCFFSFPKCFSVVNSSSIKLLWTIINYYSSK